MMAIDRPRDLNSSPGVEPPSGDADGPAHCPIPVVGIGASAGGLEAFSQLLAHLPDDTGMAFVLVQHLDPNHPSQLTELLAKTTPMPVREVTDGLAVAPNQVYVIPPNTYLDLDHGVLRLTPRGEDRRQHLTVDHFFKALARECRTGAVGVVLSGTGTDGTLGVEEIKAGGGITFAQDDASAKFVGMPQSAAHSGRVDFILPPEAIARELGRIGRHPFVAAPAAPEGDGEAEAFRQVLALLRVARGVDFTLYRETTTRRRIRRRMVLHTRERLADYARFLAQDPAEVEALYHDLLINVTSFFRDPATFEALKQTAFPAILQAKPAGAPVRFWVAGCSTGQEAYSLAMALLEFLDGHAPTHPVPIQIFATDLSDPHSLHKAREGLYPENIEAEVAPERLRRFFTREAGGYRISKAIRDLCVFAKQNVARDPPFSRMDLISCRNLLIYLTAPLQKRVIPTFHYALNPTGYLLLGASETVGGFTDLFGVVDFGHRLYVKKEPTARPYPHFTLADQPPPAGAPAPAAAVTAVDWQREADRALLGLYAPPGVLVTEGLDVLQFRGRTGKFLEPAPGEPSHNLLRMARAGLLAELRRALDECRRANAPVRRRGVRIGEAADALVVDLRVVPVKVPGMSEGCYLILFEDRPEPAEDAAARPASWLRRWLRWPPAPAPAAGPPEDRLASGLQQELASTREYLQFVIEQKDAANEELKSANEEILSSNEELQSTNEELTTTKEELQSVNEELTTTNEQLQHRNVGLNRLTDDLTNLLTSANVPLVILGSDHRIRRFTPVAGKVLNLTAADVHRPIDDVKLAVDVPDLGPLLEEVITTVRVHEREVQDRAGYWYALQVHPYRTADHKIDGAVLVLIDIQQARITREDLGRRVAERTAELAQANDALRAEVAAHERAEAARLELVKQLITAQEGERQRIARELHDELGQHLAALNVRLKLAQDATPAGSPAHPHLRQLQELTELIGKEVHHLALELRPTALDDLGLNAALLNYFEGWSERSGITVDFHGPAPDDPRLPPALETALYRIVQEGLTNVLKHARARHVSLILSRSTTHVRAILEDDGQGFDPEAEVPGPPRLGLRGMRERVALLGGTLTIEAVPGKGTTVFVRIPLAGDAGA